MSKRKIGELYNKPIIEGDINLKGPNEIHKSELCGSNSEGGGNHNLLPTLNEFIDKYKYVYVWKSEVISSITKIYIEKAIYKVSNVNGMDALLIENKKDNAQIIKCIFSDKEIDIENPQLNHSDSVNNYLELGDNIRLAIILDLMLQNYIAVSIMVLEVDDINSI